MCHSRSGRYSDGTSKTLSPAFGVMRTFALKEIGREVPSEQVACVAVIVHRYTGIPRALFPIVFRCTTPVYLQSFCESATTMLCSPSALASIPFSIMASVPVAPWASGDARRRVARNFFIVFFSSLLFVGESAVVMREFDPRFDLPGYRCSSLGPKT